MEPKILELLACPACHANLSEKENFLICPKCRVKYRIEDGIPVLLIEEAESIQ